jgi:hypothetical protein
MKRLTAFLLILPSFCSSRYSAVTISDSSNRYTGQLLVALDGEMNKAEVEWVGTLRNVSELAITNTDFCVEAYDGSGFQFAPEKSWGRCVVTFRASDWEPGTSRHFEGHQLLKFSHSHKPVDAVRFVLVAKQVQNIAGNSRTLHASCSAVWPALIHVMTNLRFQPVLVEKTSYTANFSGRENYGQEAAATFLSAYTHYQGLGPLWSSAKVDTASAYLEEKDPNSCAAEITMTFSAIGSALGLTSKYVFDSNLIFESSILSQLEEESKNTPRSEGAQEDRTARAEGGPFAEAAQVTVTSEPIEAEIEIAGKFVGSTPSTLTVPPGTSSIKITKRGFEVWQRNLDFKGGDKRTIHADLEPKN